MGAKSYHTGVLSVILPRPRDISVDSDARISQLLSTLLSNPPSLPSLKTLALLNLHVSTDLMEALTQFASNRKNTTSTWLHRVVIVESWSQNPPSVPSIGALRKYVQSVDVSVGRGLPADLVWKIPGRFMSFPISRA